MTFFNLSASKIKAICCFILLSIKSVFGFSVKLYPLNRFIGKTFTCFSLFFFQAGQIYSEMVVSCSPREDYACNNGRWYPVWLRSYKSYDQAAQSPACCHVVLQVFFLLFSSSHV